MTRKQQTSSSPELRHAQKQFRQWRLNKKSRARIPEHLWKLAVKLVPKLGLNPVSRQLKIDYYSLKKRAQQAENIQPSPSAEPAFLELPTPVPATRECVIEHDIGGLLRVRLQGYQAQEIATITRSLREEQ